MKHEPYIALVRAVDVGYYNTKYTLGLNEDGSEIKTDLFPSLAISLQTKDVKQMPGAERANACCVLVNDKPFWVGPEAAENVNGVDPRLVLDDYSESDQHLALLRGALYYMLKNAGGRRDMVIRRLVVGLPLTTYPTHRKALKARCVGVHHVDAWDETRRVTVEDVHVIPQPQGSLMNFGRNGGVDGLTLVVDVGGGTIDWYVATKKNANFQRSGAHAKGMLACAEAVAKAADKPQWLDQYNVMHRIDLAIREGRDYFRAAGSEWPLAKYRNAIHAPLEESLGKMMAKVNGTDDIDQIVITGGGATVFRNVIEERRADLVKRINVDRDPVYSNVRGFQLFGEYMAKRSANAAR
jgi:plasmid segregation protein ParM